MSPNLSAVPLHKTPLAKVRATYLVVIDQLYNLVYHCGDNKSYDWQYHYFYHEYFLYKIWLPESVLAEANFKLGVVKVLPFLV